MIRRLQMIAGVALMFVSANMRAQAAAPTLPPDSIAPNTIIVVNYDAGHFSPDLLRQTAQNLLGPQNQRAEDSINKFKEKYDKARAAGVEAATITIGSQPKDEAGAGAGGDTPMAVYLHLKNGADPKAAEEVISSEMTPQEREKNTFERRAGFLIMHPKNQALPTKTDANRARAFSDAIATIPDASFRIAFIPDAYVKNEMLKKTDEVGQVKGAREAVGALANSKWVTLAITLGNAPAISANANTADAAGAKQLADSINSALDDMKQQANNPNGQGGPMAGLAPLIAQLAEGLRPTTNGNQVAVNIKGQTLSTIGNIASSLFMRAAPGGGGRRPGGPPPQ